MGKTLLYKWCLQNWRFSRRVSLSNVGADVLDFQNIASSLLPSYLVCLVLNCPLGELQTSAVASLKFSSVHPQTVYVTL